MNPEFLSEGVAVKDFLKPDRIVLGCDDDKGAALLRELYDPFDPAVPRITTNPSTAEMIKYASNSLLATLISYANEIAGLCSSLGGIDVSEVMHGVHLANEFRLKGSHSDAVLSDQPHPMIAPITSFLEAGCGFGGSCLPKDVSALVAHGRARGNEMPLLEAVLEINRKRPAEMLGLLQRRFKSLAGLRVAVLGLAFKPGTDDIRLSPALKLIELLYEAGASLTLYDPLVAPDADPHFGPPAHFASSLEEALADQDAVLIVTRWDEFTRIPDLIANHAQAPVVIDGRRMIQPDAVPAYEGIGL